MRFSRALIPTVKEAPSEAVTASHILLMRAGFIRRVGAGLYSFLPLGFRVLKKLERLIVEEMDRAGAQQLVLPALLPADYFKESGRWDLFGDTLFRLKDRKNTDYHLGPTHEEIICDLARRELQSWRDLPSNLYQIQMKFRDEPRPRAGLLRCREFVMKDAYSFDADEAGALHSYETMRDAYRRIFSRAGLDFRMVSADSGAMGGSLSAEFQVLAQSGEDQIAACSKCEYAANLEVATTPPKSRGPELDAVPAPERVDTPMQKSIEQVAKFLNITAADCLKALLFKADGKIVMAVVRGDHEVNEIKLSRALGVREVTLASAEDSRAATGAATGSIGPVGFEGRILIDGDAALLTSAVCGANIDDVHLRNVQPGRDFQAEQFDLRNVVQGDACPECGHALGGYRGIEAGHIFVLGTYYTEKMNAYYLDKEQKKRLLVMGCYGIGVSRLVAAAVEQHHDQMGISWPMSIAPYQVHLVQLGDGPDVEAAVAQLEGELEAKGIEVLVDDRNERPGVKFKDADLIGVPLRLTVGAKSLAAGGIELKLRANVQDKQGELLPLGSAADAVAQRVQTMLGAI